MQTKNSIAKIEVFVKQRLAKWNSEALVSDNPREHSSTSQAIIACLTTIVYQADSSCQ